MATDGRGRFASAAPGDILLEAGTFARYRQTTLPIIRQADLMARRMFLRDLRELDRMSFPEMQLVMQLLSYFPPGRPQSRQREWPSLRRNCPPRKLRRYSSYLSALGSFFKPNQLMANFISRELARGEIHVPGYTPYIAADVSVPHWPVPASAHTLAITKWSNNRQAERAGIPQKLPFQAWPMYRLRFVAAAAICGAWAPFGGISAQMSNILFLRQLETTKNIDTAMAYDTLLSDRLAESARARAERTAGAVDFAELLSTGRARFKVQAVAHCVRAPNGPPVKNPTNHKPGDKPDTKRVWLPKKEYSAMLAADEAASADQAHPSSPNRGRKRTAGRKRHRPPSRRRRSPAKDTRQKIP